jgi:hypothetical protein
MKNNFKLYNANFSLLTLGTKETFQPSYTFSLSFTRHYHSPKFHRSLIALYAVRGRKIPLRPFEEKPLQTCQDLRSKEAVSTFFKQFNGKGGIYKYTLINKPNVFYIGSTIDLWKRFKQHTAKDSGLYNDDVFHSFAVDVGWDKFEFAVLEIIIDLPTMRKRENYYLKSYSPLLNTKLTSTIKIKKTPKKKDY